MIAQSLMQSVMNLSSFYGIFDVDVRAVASAEDGYWAAYKFKQKVDPQET